MLMTEEAQVYTIAEAAKLLKVSEETIRRLITDGTIEATRVGRQYRITRETIDKFLGRI